MMRRFERESTKMSPRADMTFFAVAAAASAVAYESFWMTVFVGRLFSCALRSDCRPASSDASFCVPAIRITLPSRT